MGKTDRDQFKVVIQNTGHLNEPIRIESW